MAGNWIIKKQALLFCLIINAYATFISKASAAARDAFLATDKIDHLDGSHNNCIVSFPYFKNLSFSDSDNKSNQSNVWSDISWFSIIWSSTLHAACIICFIFSGFSIFDSDNQIPNSLKGVIRIFLTSAEFLRSLALKVSGSKSSQSKTL